MFKMMNAKVAILYAMATHTPIISEAVLTNKNQGMNGAKNGGPPTFKRNRRAQMRRNK